MSEPGVLISIITPCYNHGQYLDEAIESIQSIKTPYTYEHIIVNDGSTDDFTIQKLQQLQANGHTVIHQKNLGLATARNNAIAIAKGKYIIPLDADNKLHQNYLTKAIDILERDETVDVVYGNRILFGEETRLLRNKPFNIPKLLSANYIDACAVIRKNVFNKTIRFDAAMPKMGHEDWELWVNIYFNGGKFFFLDDVCFYYRVAQNSMRTNDATLKFKKNKTYIINKHSDYLLRFFNDNYEKVEYLKKNKLKGSLHLLLGKMF